MNCAHIIIIFLIVYFANDIPMISYIIDLPVVKFVTLGLIIYFANCNTTYALNLIVIYLFLYNMSISKVAKENLSAVENFQQYEYIDRNNYDDDIEFR